MSDRDTGKMTCIAKAAIIFAFLSMCSISVAEVPPPYFHVSFDGEGYGVEGKHTNVRFRPSFENIPPGQIVEGVRGKGLLPLGGGLAMEDRRLLPAGEGTLSLWVKPVGWAEGKPRGHFMSGSSNGANLLLYMYLTNTFWYEGFVRPDKGLHVQMVGRAPFSIWKDGQWRMLTMVYRKGTRELYIDDYLYDRKTELQKNHIEPGTYLEFGAGSKVMDEFSLWDVSLSADEIAMLYYSQRTGINARPSFCLVPRTAKKPRIDGKEEKDVWKDAASIYDWCDSFAGSAADVADSVMLTHNGDFLYVLYRQPLPKDYETEKTLYGGYLFSTKIKNDDGPVWQDDAVELRLSPDEGKTVYRLIYGASGATYDSKNGDKSFTVSTWRAVAEETQEYWRVEFKVPLAALAGKPGVTEWGFNILRHVRQRGYAKRQWSYLPRDAHSLGKIKLATEPFPRVRTRRQWEAGAGQLALQAKGNTKERAALRYNITPLHHANIRPDDDVLNPMFERKEGKSPIERITGTKELVPVGGKLDFKEVVSYTARKAALARLSVTGADGRLLYSNDSLIAAKSMMALNVINLPSKDIMLAEIVLPNKKMLGSDVSAQVTLKTKKDGKVFAVKEIRPFKKVAEAAQFDVKKLPLGKIEFIAELFSKGKKIGEVKKDFYHSGKPVWWGKHVGELKAVPEPWKPIAVKGDKVHLYEKTYSFEDSLLPTQVNVSGNDLLNGPIRLVIVSGDKTIDTTGARVSCTVGPAGLKTEIHGKKSDTKFTMSQESFIEYDGYHYSTITLTPKSTLRIDRVYLEIPFKKEYATVFDDSSYNMFGTQSGAIPAEGLACGPKGLVRIGSPDYGIQFSSALIKNPSDNFRVKEKTPTRIKPSDNSMVYTCTMLDEPITRTKPISVTLAVFALPVRPYDKSTRKIYHGGSHRQRPYMEKLRDKDYRLVLYWDSGWTGIYRPEGRYYHLSNSFLDRLGTQRLDWWNKYNQFTCFYVSPSMQDTASPEYAYFQDEWRTTPHLDLSAHLRELKDFNGFDKPTSHKSFGQACWATRGVADYWMYCIDKCLRRVHAKGVPIGIYVDNAGGYECNNPYHVHVGFEKAHGGVRGSIGPGMREWTKRLRNVVKSIDPEGHVVIHMSGFRSMPVWSMADVLVEGEQYTANWHNYTASRPELTNNDCYPTVLPLDRFRASYASRLWGPLHVFLTQFGGNPVQDRKLRRHLSGLAWVHDTPLWGEIWPNDVWFKLAEWGWDETVEFVGYWNSGELFSLDAGGIENIVASLWYREDGKVVAMIFNDTDKAAKATLKINADKFPVKIMNITKAVDISSPDELIEPDKKESDAFKVQNGAVTARLRARDYRFLMFE